MALAEVVDSWQQFCKRNDTDSEGGEGERNVTSGTMCPDAHTAVQGDIGGLQATATMVDVGLIRSDLSITDAYRLVLCPAGVLP